jgi:hypothetical protein
MNKRILELAKQAGLKYSAETQLSPAEAKFAELIVQSCQTQVALIGIANLENDENGDINWTVRASIDMMGEHFGVE